MPILKKDTETANFQLPTPDTENGGDALKSAPEEEKNGEKKEDDGEKADLGNFWRILSYGTALDRILMGAASLSSIGAGVTLPLMNVVFGNVVNDFNGFFMPDTTVTKEQFLSSVNQNALYIVYLFIAKFLLAYVSMFSFRMTGIRISAAIRLAYVRSLFAQSISVFDNLPSGKPTSVITTSANTIQLGISEKLSTLIQFLALTVAAYVVAFQHSWQLTLASSSAIIFIFLMYSISVPIHMKYQRAMENSNESASSIAGEVFASIRTIVACGAEGRLSEKYAQWMAESRKRGLKMSYIVGAQFAPAFFAMYCNFALTFWLGIKLYSEGHIGSSGTVVVVFFSVLLVVAALGNIAMPVMGITKAASSAAGFFTIIDAPVPNTSGAKGPEASAYEDITFTNVSFVYPSRPEVKVFDGMNVRFAKGKITAIVGPSGSGKSTIVALLERWYQLSDTSSQEGEEDRTMDEGGIEGSRESTSGTITVGKHRIEELDLKWWRSQIGLVQQEPFSFNDTIYRNVEYGLVGTQWENEPEDVKRKLVEEACHEAFADEFINRLPQGDQTRIGENGIKLSGGQRQRLAIARSIIKRPAILILDEATSSIDVRGERIVQQALDRVSKNRTTITIAHRLSTIMKADNIVVLKGGSVVEQGTHDGLLSANGVYHDLVNAQHLEVADAEEAEDMDELVDFDKISSRKSKDDKADTTTDYKDSQSGTPAYKAKPFTRIVGLLLYEQRDHYRILVVLVLAAMGGGAAFALQSFIFANVITVFQRVGQSLMDGGNFWALMFFVEAIGVGICYFLLGYFANELSTYVATFYRRQYFETLIRKPIAFYDAENRSAGTLTSQLSTDPNQVQELFGPNMTMPLIAVFNVLGCVAISFAYGWKLTLVAMFSAFPVIFLAGFVRVRYEIQFEQMNSAVFAESSQFAAEAIGAFRTVTSLTLEDTITDRYAKLLSRHVTDAFKRARLATLIFAASDSIDLLCMALAFWYGGKLLSTREYDVEQFFVIYMSIIQGGQGAGQWASLAPNIAQCTLAANRILGVREHAQSDKPSNPVSWKKAEGGPRIEFDHVTFQYPTRDVPVFKDLNLTVESGQFAALVGPSGCGKTTTVTLLERFYDPQSGRIICDGADIATLDMEEYRKSLSLVSQEPTLYQGSVKDNVLLGVDPTQVTDDDIHAACRDAEIHDFIISLPQGYATDVGLKGVALSGGQKQRISIARALIRNPRVLLLDEATSSLDSESEKLVQAAFERAANGRTMVVVAHRLATVQNADVIFVFGEGHGGVVEVGDHRTLLRKKGAYWQMCQAQALDR